MNAKTMTNLVNTMVDMVHNEVTESVEKLEGKLNQKARKELRCYECEHKKECVDTRQECNAMIVYKKAYGDALKDMEKECI